MEAIKVLILFSFAVTCGTSAYTGKKFTDDIPYETTVIEEITTTSYRIKNTTAPDFTTNDFTNVTTPGYPNVTETDPELTTTDNWNATETTTIYPEETTTTEPVPAQLDITYHLYNSKGRDFIYNSSCTEIFYLDHEVGTVVLIHSHAENRFDRFSSNVLKAFENFHDFNVFVMDWSQLSATHLDALNNLQSAANDLATFIETVRITKGAVNNRQVHFVGFGTGAHLAGNAAFDMYSILPIGRVTGLDPTRGIDGHNTSHVLSSADASYVEAIHTNGGNGENHGIGLTVAHVDFYPNGGERQPGCWSHACNHNRSWELFMASLEFDHHRGFRCLDMNQMIEDNCYGLPDLGLGGIEFMKVPMLPGIYRLNTTSIFPF